MKTYKNSVVPQGYIHNATMSYSRLISLKFTCTFKTASLPRLIMYNSSTNLQVDEYIVGKYKIINKLFRSNLAPLKISIAKTFLIVYQLTKDYNTTGFTLIQCFSETQVN